VNTNNGVKWRRFIIPKKVEQVNDHLFIDTYKSNNMKIGVNDMTVNEYHHIARWLIFLGYVLFFFVHLIVLGFHCS